MSETCSRFHFATEECTLEDPHLRLSVLIRPEQNGPSDPGSGVIRRQIFVKLRYLSARGDGRAG